MDKTATMVTVISAFDKAGAKTLNDEPAEFIAQKAALVRRRTQRCASPLRLLPRHQHHRCSNRFCYYPPIQEHHLTCRTGCAYLLHHINIQITQVTPRRSRNPDIYQTLQRPSARPVDLLHLKAQRATRVIGTPADQDLRRGFRGARRQLRWKEYRDRCSTKAVNPQSSLANSCGGWQCTSYVWLL